MKKIILCTLCMILTVSCLFTFVGCDEHEHAGDEWGGDKHDHWYICDICNGAFDAEEHDFEESMDGLDVVKTCKICDYSYVAKSVPAHEHTFGEEFAYNEAFHYKSCTFEDCLEQGEKAEHIYGTPEIIQETGKITKTYKCQYCAYEKVEVITVNTVMKDESAWNLAFDNLELNNFQLTVTFVAPSGDVYKNECIMTEDGFYAGYRDGRGMYTRKRADGKYDLYISDDGTTWTFYEDAEGLRYQLFARESVIKINYAENFDKFTYNEATGEYTCAERIECTAYEPDGEPYSSKMICFNNVVKVADGKISHIECDYFFEGEEDDETMSFIYYNIGIAEFEIPEKIKESAVHGGDYDGGY